MIGRTPRDIGPGHSASIIGRHARFLKSLLTHAYIGIYSPDMARAATTSDVFNAIAEPRRRAILDLLRVGERSVSDLVTALRMEQPAVSKHLRVLKEVGLVIARRVGRRRLYRLDAEELKTVHDWTRAYERFWAGQLDRVKASAERKTRAIRREASARNKTGDR
jgi:DNA-binding transcriptional ArsR family regulator